MGFGGVLYRTGQEYIEISVGASTVVLPFGTGSLADHFKPFFVRALMHAERTTHMALVLRNKQLLALIIDRKSVV